MTEDELAKRLDFYLKLKKPDYAIMITGKWGTGKTFFIEKFRKSYSWFWIRRPVYISLYGIKDESEIENQIFIKSLYNSLEKIIIPFVVGFVLFFLGSILLEKTYEIRESDSFIQWMGLLGSIICFLLIWFYKTFRTLVLRVVLLWNNIILDDFERSEIPFDNLLAYLNRYVEHLHKHVIIVCNEEEIKIEDKNKDSFQKIQEKIIGEKIRIDQDAKKVLYHLWKNGDFHRLKAAVNNKSLGFDWFVSVSVPHDSSTFEQSTHHISCQTNYRIWKRCCQQFELVFSNIDKDVLCHPIIAEPLIKHFFPIVYATQLYDFGNGKHFSKNDVGELFGFPSKSNPLKWFHDLYPNIDIWNTILSKQQWKKIVENRQIDSKATESLWREIIAGKESFFSVLGQFLKHSDIEVDNAWLCLKKTFKAHSVTEPELIADTVLRVFEMISCHCCPDQTLKPKDVYSWMKWYCRHLSFSLNTDELFDSRTFLAIHSGQLDEKDYHFFKEAITFLEKKVNSYSYRTVVPSRFNMLLSILSNNRIFHEQWFTNDLRLEELFSEQNPDLLLQALCKLPLDIFGMRIFRILDHLEDCPFHKKESYIVFKKHFVECIQKALDDSQHHFERAQRFYLEIVVKRINDDLKRIEEPQD